MQDSHRVSRETLAEKGGAHKLWSKAEGTFAPIRIIELEIANPLPDINYDGQHSRVWVLIRLLTRPIGIYELHLRGEGITSHALAAWIWSKCGGSIDRLFSDAELQAPGALSVDGLNSHSGDWSSQLGFESPTADLPAISVVLCTRNRPTQLANCLSYLVQQNYHDFEVVIVDNDPSFGNTRELVEAKEFPKFRYTSEPRPGLSWARNTGVRAASNEIIAFLDDDDEPDENWLRGIARGFSVDRLVGCVTGIVLPARLDTEAQEIFEKLGGHSKGRAFETEVFSRRGPQSPLYPLPPFGAGANMAFRREVLTAIGGFDVALGAGTATHAGEDSLAFTLTLLAGYKLVYEPSALMWHHHRAEMESLRRQLQGYSVGLRAF